MIDKLKEVKDRFLQVEVDLSKPETMGIVYEIYARIQIPAAYCGKVRFI